MYARSLNRKYLKKNNYNKKLTTVFNFNKFKIVSKRLLKIIMLNQDYFSKEPLPMPWRENGVFSQEVCFDKFKVKGKYECILIESMFHHYYQSMTVQIKKQSFLIHDTLDFLE